MTKKKPSLRIGARVVCTAIVSGAATRGATGKIVGPLIRECRISEFGCVPCRVVRFDKPVGAGRGWGSDGRHWYVPASTLRLVSAKKKGKKP